MASKSHGSGVSRLALATMLAAIPAVAAAQVQTANGNAFQGQASFNMGEVTFSGGTGQDFITVNVPQAVINWTPTNGGNGVTPIDFLPNGNSVLFGTGAGLPYTVLNRIIPTNANTPIQFNGMVDSGPLGSIWFYAPGGLILGSTAQFDVGSLLLTTADPLTDAGGNFLTTAGGITTFELTNTGSPTAAIRLNGGASIAATNPNSYVILQAPQVITENNSQVDVNGSLAMVAAESARFRMAGGLFDIAVTSGTSVTDAMQIGGRVIGANAPTAADRHRMYFVAVPKNEAITMAFTGDNSGGLNPLGFAIAGAASIEGNTVVLSAGYDVFEATSSLAGPDFLPSVASSGQPANISLTGRDVNSFATFRSTGSTSLRSTDQSSQITDVFFNAGVEFAADDSCSSSEYLRQLASQISGVSASSGG